MFSKSSKSPRPALPTSATGGKSIPFSLIGGDVTITGDLSASVDLHVDGVVEGDIRCAALVQGPDSRIIGHVTAQSARLAGLVDGSIAAGGLGGGKQRTDHRRRRLRTYHDRTGQPDRRPVQPQGQ